MAAFSWFRRRNLPQILTQCVRLVSPGRRLHDGGGLPGRRLQGPGRGLHGSPWGKSRSSEQQQVNWTELDKADALMLRKSHETGFLSWFRNGLLATGIGVIAFVQSEVGREAGYAFFILGGVCVSFGGASYVASLLSLRRLLLLSLPAVLLHCAVVSSVALFWLCAVSLYIGRLEVEIIHEEEEEEEEEEEGRDEGSECRDCRNRRDQERGGYRSHDNKGQDK